MLTRLLIRMMMAYLTESELPLSENLNSVRLIIRNVRAVADLLKADQALRPTPQEVRQAVINQALDDPSEEWGLDL